MGGGVEKKVLILCKLNYIGEVYFNEAGGSSKQTVILFWPCFTVGFICNALNIKVKLMHTFLQIGL